MLKKLYTKNRFLCLTTPVVIIAGILLSFAFSPVGYYLLAIIAPAALFSVCCRSTAKQAALLSWLFGLGFFTSSVYWVWISIDDDGNTPLILTWLMSAVFIAFLSSFFALQNYLLARFFPKNNASKLLLAFPAIWILSEYLRSHLLTGFPWMLIGYSQTDSALAGFIPIVGVYGTGFITLFCSGLLVLCLQPARKPTTTLAAIFALLLCFAGGSCLTKINWSTPNDKKLSVSLIQGNIPWERKWNLKYIQNTLQTYQLLTESQWDKDLIIWPESALPVSYHLLSSYTENLNQQAKKNNSAILIGSPSQLSKTSDYYYNGLFALGEAQGTYYKRHLVPFGEFVPFENWLRGLIGFFDLPMSTFKPGPKQQALIQAKQMQIAPFICYEIAYPHLVYSALPKANLLVTISDDSWFGNSPAAWQHLQIARVRAIETGRYLLFATNTGVSAIIDDKGKVLEKGPRFERALINGEIQGRSGLTPIVFFNTWPIIMLLLLCLGLARRRQSPL